MDTIPSGVTKMEFPFFYLFTKSVWESVGSMTFPATNDPNSYILMYPNTIRGRYLRLIVTESNNAADASLAEVMLTAPK